jgi:hypothetical protein
MGAPSVDGNVDRPLRLMYKKASTAAHWITLGVAGDEEKINATLPVRRACGHGGNDLSLSVRAWTRQTTPTVRMECEGGASEFPLSPNYSVPFMPLSDLPTSLCG